MNPRQHPTRIAAARLYFLLVAVAAGAVAAPPGPAAPDRYRIEVKGPLGDFTANCADPCEVDETESRPRPAPGVSIQRNDDDRGHRRGRKTSTLKRDPSLSYAEEGIVCIGDCAPEPASSTVMIGPLVSLREGVELRIRQGRARFVFHSIVERDSGPATRRRLSQFRIDRPRIELDLYGHRVFLVRISSPDPGRTAEPASSKPGVQ